MIQILCCLAVFNLLPSMIKTDSCGEVDIIKYGTITSPGHPEVYPQRASCEWNFTAPRGDEVTLSFPAFCVEKGIGHECRHDRVSIIFDQSSQTDLCGCGRRPRPIRGGFTTLTVAFSSDDSIGMAGFNMSVEFEKGLYPEEGTTRPTLEQELPLNSTTIEFRVVDESQPSASTTIKADVTVREITSTGVVLTTLTTSELTDTTMTYKPTPSTPAFRESIPSIKPSSESGGINVFVFFLVEVLTLGAVYYYLQYRTGQDDQFVRHIEQKLDQYL